MLFDPYQQNFWSRLFSGPVTQFLSVHDNPTSPVTLQSYSRELMAQHYCQCMSQSCSPNLFITWLRLALLIPSELLSLDDLHYLLPFFFYFFYSLNAPILLFFLGFFFFINLSSYESLYFPNWSIFSLYFLFFIHQILLCSSVFSQCN